MKNSEIHEKVTRMAKTLTGIVMLVAGFGGFLQIYIYRNNLKTGMKLFSSKLIYGCILIAAIWVLYFIYYLFARRSDKQ